MKFINYAGIRLFLMEIEIPLGRIGGGGGPKLPEWGLTPGCLGKGRVYRESLMKVAGLIRETSPEEGGEKTSPSCDDIRRDFPGNFQWHF